ncbi:hypothetical protein G3I55_28335, partial [Streptomyces sp. SID6648]|nr:hypothetical protein [Streptomyces sp. SID6648]
MRREYRKTSREDLFNLVTGTPHGRRGGDDHGSDFAPVHNASGEFVYDSLVQPDHGSESITDEVEFVLDDQIWRPWAHCRLEFGAWQPLSRWVIAPTEAVEIRVVPTMSCTALLSEAEQGCGGSRPGQLRELVYGGDDEGWRE